MTAAKLNLTTMKSMPSLARTAMLISLISVVTEASSCTMRHKQNARTKDEQESEAAQVTNLLKQQLCSESVKIAGLARVKIGDTWLDDKSNPKNVFAAFANAGNKHLSYIDGLQKFRDKYSAVPNTLEELKAALSELGNTGVTANDQLFPVLNDEVRVQNLLEESKAGIVSALGTIKSANTLCKSIDPVITSQLADLSSSLTKIQEEVQNMSLFISVAQHKRFIARNNVIDRIRESLETRFSQATNRSIRELDRDINEWKVVDALTGKVYSWKFEAIIRRGPGHGLVSKYQQYLEPLAIVTSDIKRGKSLRAEVLAIGGDTSAAERNNLVGILDQNIRALEEFLITLTSAGAQGKMEKQKTLSGQRAARVNVATPASCVDAIAKFKVASDHASGAEQFFAAALLYTKEVDACDP